MWAYPKTISEVVERSLNFKCFQTFRLVNYANIIFLNFFALEYYSQHDFVTTIWIKWRINCITEEVILCIAKYHNVQLYSYYNSIFLYNPNSLLTLTSYLELINNYFYFSFQTVNELTLCFIASSTKDVWLKYPFWNKKGSSKKIHMSATSMSRWMMGCYIRSYLENQQKIELMKQSIK